MIQQNPTPVYPTQRDEAGNRWLDEADGNEPSPYAATGLPDEADDGGRYDADFYGRMPGDFAAAHAEAFAEAYQGYEDPQAEADHVAAVVESACPGAMLNVGQQRLYGYAAGKSVRSHELWSGFITDPESGWSDMAAAETLRSLASQLINKWVKRPGGPGTPAASADERAAV